MPEVNRDPLGFKKHPNYMELVRAYARLHHWASEYAGNRIDVSKMHYELGYTLSIMATALDVSYDKFVDVSSKLFIGDDSAGQGGVGGAGPKGT